MQRKSQPARAITSLSACLSDALSPGWYTIILLSWIPAIAPSRQRLVSSPG